MKKLYFATLGVLALLCSCSTEGSYEATATYKTYNFVFPTDESEEPSVAPADYDFHFTSDMEGDVTCTDFKLAGENNTLTISGYNYKTSWFEGLGSQFVFEGGTGSVKGLNLPVKDFKGIVTSAIAYTTSPVIGITTISPNLYGPHVLLSYNLGDKYHVKTYFKDTYFKGETVTWYNYNNEEKSFTNKGITYRLVFSSDFKTASLVIYNGKFAAEQPDKAVYEYLLLENLPVTLKYETFSISATNVIPLYPEGGKLELQPRYLFNDIKVETLNDNMGRVKISFNVAGMYKGEFTGSCMLTDL